MENTFDEPLDVVNDDLVVDVSTETGDDAPIKETEAEVADDLPKILYEELTSRNLLLTKEDDPFDGSLDWIEKQMDELPNRVQSNLIQSLPAEAQDFVDLLLTKPNLSKDDFRKFYNDFLNDEQPTIETVDEARTLLEKVYAEKGLKPKAIQAQLDDLEDEDQLLAEAQKEIQSKGSKVKETLEQTKQEIAEQQKYFQTFLNDVQTEIKTLTPNRQAAINKIAPNVGQIVNEISANPKAYTQLLDILTYYKDGKFDLSVFEKEAATKATNTLKDRLSKVSVSTVKRETAPSTNTQKYEFLPD